MGVSQSPSIMDFQPVSGLPSSKRAASTANQAMFDIALKSAAEAPQVSKPVERNQGSSVDSEAGKPVPVNGNERPEVTNKASLEGRGPSANNEPVHTADMSTASEEITDGTADTSDISDGLQEPEGSEQSAEGYAKEQEQEQEEASAVAAKDAEADESDSVSLSADLRSSELGTSDADSAERLEMARAELQSLLADLESGSITGEVFLKRLQEALQTEKISLSDVEGLLTGEGSGQELAALLKDKEGLITQLQAMMKPGEGLHSLLVGKAEGADTLARISAALSDRGGVSKGGQVSSFVDVLKEEGARSNQAGSLVSQILQEKESGKGADPGFDKDRLFEQLLNHRAGESSAKVSGFAALVVKESAAGGLGAAAGNGVSPGVASAEGGSGLLQRPGLSTSPQVPAQLPVLRGLPGQNPGATEALNERIMMMRSKGIQTAEIRLDPPELGSLEVRVRVSGDTTTIQFHSPNPSVREALEAQVNRLREMMDEAGVNLGNVDVSDQSLSEGPEESFASAPSGRGGQDGDEGETSDVEGQVLRVSHNGLGLVDYFA